MHFRTPETGKLTPYGWAGLLGAKFVLIATATACGAEGSQQPANTPGREAATATVSETPQQRWPGLKEEFHYPGVVELTPECQGWDTDNPGPIVMQDGKLIAMIDARDSAPPECDQKLDIGAGIYSGPSTESSKVSVQGNPDWFAGGPNRLADGTAVQIVTYTTVGQYACRMGEHPYGTATWYGVQWNEGTGWVSGINMTVPSAERLSSAGIAPDVNATQYQGTHQGGCPS